MANKFKNPITVVPGIPVGTNKYDILTWNGTEWVARPFWQIRYQPVEYIESTGTQYISLETNFVYDNMLQVVVDFESAAIQQEGQGGGGVLTGYVEVSGNHNFWCGVNTNSGFRVRIGNGNITVPPFDTQRHTFDIKSGSQKLDNAEVGTTVAQTVKSKLFVFTGTDPVGDPVTFISAKIYSIKYYRGDTIIYNLVPAYKISNGKIGMYDILNDEFYSNAGTGEFIKGPDIVT